MTQNPAPTGVTVTTPIGTRTEDVKHEIASAIDIHDGHLLVKKVTGPTSAKVIAIYSPGKWLSAVVNYAS